MNNQPKEKYLIISLQGEPAEKERKGAEVIALINEMDNTATPEIVGGALRAVFVATANPELIKKLEAYPMQKVKDKGCLDLAKAGYQPIRKK